MDNIRNDHRCVTMRQSTHERVGSAEAILARTANLKCDAVVSSLRMEAVNRK